MAKENRGGARINSGRKPLDEKEKKVGINIYVKQKFINKHKTKEALKKKIIAKIEAGLI